MQRYLLIDGSNIAHASQGAPKLTVGTIEVQAIFGFLRTVRKLAKLYPQMRPVVLWDGASWRNMIYPDYKIGRDKNHTKAYEKMQAERESAKKQVPAIKKALELIGVSQVRASNMEADDLAAITADLHVKRGNRVLLCSGDKDWIQLVGPGIGWFDPINDRKIFKAEDVEQALGYPVRDFKQFVEMKALMGDAGDSVPGVGGIGEKGAVEFMQTWGSWADFSNGCLDGSIDPKKLPKKFRLLAEDEDKRIAFGANLKLVDLRTTARPAPLNLTVNKGTPSKERFAEFCRRFLFQSILKDLDQWLSVFEAFQPPFDPPYVEKAA